MKSTIKYISLLFLTLTFIISCDCDCEDITVPSGTASSDNYNASAAPGAPTLASPTNNKNCEAGTSVDVSPSPDDKYPSAPSAANNGFFVPPPGFYENLTAQIQLDFVPKDV